jgi:hypothetical protein
VPKRVASGLGTKREREREREGQWEVGGASLRQGYSCCQN